MTDEPVLLRRHVRAPADRVWALLTDFAGHGRWFPATRMELDPGSPRLGWSFVGITGVGPFALRDPMVITCWEPPVTPGAAGVFELRKTGRVLDGWARVHVVPSGRGTDIVWRELIMPRPRRLGRRVAWLSARTTGALLEHVLDGVCRDAEGGDPDPVGRRHAG